MEPMKFYEEMASLIKGRDHAKNMVIKWQKKAEDLEAAIEELVAEQTHTEQVTEE